MKTMSAIFVDPNDENVHIDTNTHTHARKHAHTDTYLTKLTECGMYNAQNPHKT